MSVPAARQDVPRSSSDGKFADPDEVAAEPAVVSPAVRGGAAYRWSFVSLFVRVILQGVSGIIIARQIGPSRFGTGMLILSVYVVLSGFITSGANGTMMVRRHLSRALILRLVAIDIAFGVLGAGGLFVTALLQHGATRAGFFVASAGCLLDIVAGPGYALSSRALRFGRISAGETIGAVVGTAVAITISSTTHSLVALPVQAVLIDAGICLVVVRSVFVRPQALGEVATTDVGVRYGLQTAGNQLASVGARNADNYLIAAFLGQAALGLYVLAYRLMMLPIQNIAMVLTRVLIPRLRHLAGGAGSTTNEVRSLLLAIALPVGAITGAGLPFVHYGLIQLLGNKYAGAVGPTEVLLLASFPQCCTNVTSSVLASTGHGRTQLRLTSIGLVFAVLAVVIGQPWGIVGVTVVYLIFTVTLAIMSVTVLSRAGIASVAPFLESARFFAVLAGACASASALARVISPNPGPAVAVAYIAAASLIGIAVSFTVSNRATRASIAFWSSVARGAALPGEGASAPSDSSARHRAPSVPSPARVIRSSDRPHRS